MEDVQKDIEFALMVNEEAKRDPTIQQVVVNNEPYRQFIVETQMLRTHKVVEWFEDPTRKGWADQIHRDRELYEVAQDEKTEISDQQNAVQEELATLKAKVEQLLAEQDETPADVEPEAEVEPDAEETDETDEDETDEPDEDETGEE